MIFSANTGLGYIWVKYVREGTYTLEQVPNLGNLREVVAAAVSENGGNA